MALIFFIPDSFKVNPHPPTIVISDFLLLNQSAPLRGTEQDSLGLSPLEHSILYTDKLTLHHWQNDFAFEFAALDFENPAKNRYRCQLEGYDKVPREISVDHRFAAYTNISPGNYIFRVWGSNNDEVWNEVGKSIFIHIHTPWWKRWWAYSLYSLLIGGLLYTFYYFQLNHQLQIAENRRLKELDAVKTTLYTNITHEFRTPLTVILGMVKQIREHPKKWYFQGLDMIERNGNNLLRLVNQMLELRKLESGTIKVNWVNGDIIQYLRYISGSLLFLCGY